MFILIETIFLLKPESKSIRFSFSFTSPIEILLIKGSFSMTMLLFVSIVKCFPFCKVRIRLSFDMIDASVEEMSVVVRFDRKSSIENVDLYMFSDGFSDFILDFRKDSI